MNGRPTARRARRLLRGGVLAAGLLCAGCGDSPTPVAPAAAPEARLTLTPAPPAIEQLGTENGSVGFRVTAGVTVELAGGGQIDVVQIAVTTLRDVNGIATSTTSTHANNVTIAFTTGSASFTNTSTFSVTSGARAATWTLSVSGADRLGRPFSTSAPAIDLPLPQ